MRHAGCSLIIAASLILILPPSASSQYLYLDTNGDGIHSTADKLSAVGPTLLTIYLDTNHDRDGSLQTCNSHSSAFCGASTTADSLAMFSFQVVLHVIAGRVTWGTFNPDTSAYTALQPQLSDSTDLEISFGRPVGTFSPPGLSSLGRISVSVTSGLPRIEIARSTSLDPFSFGTGFGTTCTGSAYPSTYMLGALSDPCGSSTGSPGDWFDGDGTLPPPGPVLTVPSG